MKSFISLLIIGIICFNNYILSAQDAPITTIGEVVSDSTTIIVPLTVTGFSDITVSDLTLNYDSDIATVTSVTLGPGVMQTYFVTDIDVPGTILVAWLYFQGLTLPDNSVFINITFERVSYGYSAIEFDNSLPDNCLWADTSSNELNDIPNSTYYIDGSLTFEMINAPITNAPNIDLCEGITPVNIPVTVSDFEQVGTFTLTLQYDASVLSFQSFTNNSNFPNLEVIENSPGTLVASGLSSAPEGITLINNSTFFTINFNNLGGTTGVNWLDLGSSCQYTGPAPEYEVMNDAPQSAYYINGFFNELPVPLPAGNISGPEGGVVCQGESGVVFSVSPITYANSYAWVLPEGATITNGEGTPEIIVSFSGNALSGDVSVYGINECGNGTVSPSFHLIVDTVPSIIIQPTSSDTVYAGNGTAVFFVTAAGSNLDYQWQEYTNDWANVSDGGVYSGALSSSLTITDPPISMNGNKYRCVVSGSCDPPAITDGNAVLPVVIYTGTDINNFGNEDLNFKSFPNPFYDQLSFSFNAPSKGQIAIEISNIYGEKIGVLTSKAETEGHYKLNYNAKRLKPGIYIAIITFVNEKINICNAIKIIAKND